MTTLFQDTIYDEKKIIAKCARQFIIARKNRHDSQEAADGGTMAGAANVVVPPDVPDGVIWQNPENKKRYVRIAGLRVVMVFEV